jgi:hypothetical protein
VLAVRLRFTPPPGETTPEDGTFQCPAFAGNNLLWRDL